MAFPWTLNLSFARISGLMVLDMGAGGAVNDNLSPLLRVICGRTRFVRLSLSTGGAIFEVVPRLAIAGGEERSDSIRLWLLIIERFVVLSPPITTRAHLCQNMVPDIEFSDDSDYPGCCYCLNGYKLHFK